MYILKDLALKFFYTLSSGDTLSFFMNRTAEVGLQDVKVCLIIG